MANDLLSFGTWTWGGSGAGVANAGMSGALGLQGIVGRWASDAAGVANAGMSGALGLQGIVGRWASDAALAPAPATTTSGGGGGSGLWSLPWREDVPVYDPALDRVAEWYAWKARQPSSSRRRPGRRRRRSRETAQRNVTMPRRRIDPPDPVLARVDPSPTARAPLAQTIGLLALGIAIGYTLGMWIRGQGDAPRSKRSKRSKARRSR